MKVLKKWQKRVMLSNLIVAGHYVLLQKKLMDTATDEKWHASREAELEYALASLKEALEQAEYI